MRVCVVGAGIAGIGCANALSAGGHQVEVRERSHGVGGRMANGRLAGRGADTGAQYATAADPAFAAVMDRWVGDGLARRWTDGFHAFSAGGMSAPHHGAERYAGVDGMRSLVVELARGLRVELDAPVSAVGPGPTVDGLLFDAVVLAMPDPQALRLLDSSLVAEREAVSGRRWESVLALQSAWSQRCWDPAMSGVFVNGDETLAWIADDGSRRGDGAPVLVSHSTGPFAAPRLDDPDSAGPALLEATRRILGITAEPTATRVQRWTYARPAGPRIEPWFLGDTGIGICGDGWGQPRVETAWLSGTRLAAALLDRLG